MNEREKWLPWALLIILSLIWGTSFILMKRGLEVFSAGEVGALRLVTAGLFLLPVAIKRSKRTKGRHYRLLVIVGFIGSFIPAFLFAIAQTQIRSSMAGMLNALTPFFVMIIGAWFFKLRVKLGTGLGILLGFAGALLLLFTNATDGFGTLNAYALLVVLATILYGTNLNLIKYYLADLNAVTITSLSLVIVLPPAAVYLLGFTDFIEKLTTHPDGLLATGYITILGVMSTSLALILFNKLVQMTTPVFTSSVTYLIPVVAIVWGLFDGESLLMIHFIGMAVIISGVYLINYFKNTP